ncbi:hypothetical protein [Flavobacterium sp. 5]|uniref:hypothetical protein n=1 Tax=Flavobacterium sp. 5 TaxID=2035199 RepID=UPI000C2C9D1F|nr:hypothetical protein [Flavobacterium sp. 5]PKB18352.1 hypothetical protein CLU82_3625 [Flavobacterium sp. 5]
MKTEYSGNIYSISLEFDLGLVYAELLDYSDVHSFDGILVQVYAYKASSDEKSIDNIDEIRSNGILFGPVPINKYPSIKGKYSWKYIGKSINYSKESPWFKSYRGNLFKENNWYNLKPWFKSKDFENDSKDIECNYNEIRRLETLIINHPETIKMKVSMLYLIQQGKNVGDFYDLSVIGNRNMFIQVINTYFDNDKVELLLSDAKELIKVN